MVCFKLGRSIKTKQELWKHWTGSEHGERMLTKAYCPVDCARLEGCELIYLLVTVRQSPCTNLASPWVGAPASGEGIKPQLWSCFRPCFKWRVVVNLPWYVMESLMGKPHLYVMLCCCRILVTGARCLIFCDVAADDKLAIRFWERRHGFWCL